MKYPYLIIGLIVMYFPSLNAQDKNCATRATDEDREAIRLLVLKAERFPMRIYQDNVVKVVMYRLRENDGSGARSDSSFAEEINVLNSYYTSNNICFSLMHIVNVDNSDYLNVDWGATGVADSMKTVINEDHPSFTDALTIYVLPPSTFYSGSAYGIPSTALLMTSESTRWMNSHIAHEVGHCLGNFHTHDDTDGANFEMVVRLCPIPPLPNDQGLWFDCCLGADGFCDTSADPNLGDTTDYGTPRIDGTCAYIDTTATDVWGDLFDPDVSNIMSYAPISCRTSFSGLQGDRLNITLDLNAEYSNKQADVTKELNDETITYGYKYELAKESITVANNNAYLVAGSAKVIHEAEGSIVLKPGFRAWHDPNYGSVLYLARVKDLCNNSSSIDYSH